MRHKAAAVAILLCCVFFCASCGRQDSALPENTDAATQIEFILNDERVKDVLKENVPPDSTVSICSPVYALQYDVEKGIVGEKVIMPFDAVFFPVLDGKKPVGFISYPFEIGFGDPQFMPIHDAACDKLIKKHTLKIAMARWKQYDGYNVNYIYFSDDNETNVLCWVGLPPQIDFEYGELPELQGFNLKSLDVIMTYENKAEA